GGIGVAAADEEGAAAASDGAGGEGAVAPVDRRSEVRGAVGRVRVGESRHHGAEGLPQRSGERNSDGSEDVSLGDEGRAAERGAGAAGGDFADRDGDGEDTLV